VTVIDGRRRISMVDPVCGMAVEPEGAAAAWEHQGATFLFCSVGCMERFREDPEHFLGLDDDQRSMS
jgi:YHS domain-containing protein